MVIDLGELRADRALLEVLGQAQAEGFLGRAPLTDHIVNGADFATVVAREPVGCVVDLGSGGGVPALVIARALPEPRFVLVDRGERRCAFLEGAAEVLGLARRVAVVLGDAEDVSRQAEFSEIADAVTARSFGPPAVTAEAACRFLRPGARLVVSEPPGSVGDRWSATGLAPLGLAPDAPIAGTAVVLAVCRRIGVADDRYPRRAATTRKRPLFS